MGEKYKQYNSKYVVRTISNEKKFNKDNFSNHHKKLRAIDIYERVFIQYNALIVLSSTMFNFAFLCFDN